MLKNAAFRLNQNKLCNQSRHFDGKRLESVTLFLNSVACLDKV